MGYAGAVVLRPCHAVLRPRRRRGTGAGSDLGRSCSSRRAASTGCRSARRMVRGRAARRRDRRLRDAARRPGRCLPGSAACSATWCCKLAGACSSARYPSGLAGDRARRPSGGRRRCGCSPMAPALLSRRKNGFAVPPAPPIAGPRRTEMRFDNDDDEDDEAYWRSAPSPIGGCRSRASAPPLGGTAAARRRTRSRCAIALPVGMERPRRRARTSTTAALEPEFFAAAGERAECSQMDDRLRRRRRRHRHLGRTTERRAAGASAEFRASAGAAPASRRRRRVPRPARASSARRRPR